MDSVQRLAAIAASTSASQRPAAYLACLNELLAKPSSVLTGAALVDALSHYLDNAAFSDANAAGGNLVVGRQVLSDFDAAVAKVAKDTRSHGNKAAGADDDVMTDAKSISAIADDDVHLQVLEMALEKVQPRVLSFEEQAARLRHHMADLLEETEDWLGAARVLQGISLDSGHRSVSDLVKLQTYVRIVRLLLEGDDPIGADVVLKRASLIVHNVPGALSSGFGGAYPSQQQQDAFAAMSEQDKVEAKTLGLQYKLSQARIYDAQRRFAEAAFRFHEMSYVAEIDEGERSMMLSAAVTAAILAPAGPQRSRILATLVRDERSESLPQHTILTKVFLEQLIRPAEVASFAELLSPHQRAALPKSATDAAAPAVTADTAMQGDSLDEEDVESTRTGPSTVLDRAMMEHNIIAASRLYNNITLGGLANLLDLSKVGAETMIRCMIAQSRLRADIDQVAGLVVFHEQAGAEVSSALGGTGAAQDKDAAAGAGASGDAGATATDNVDDPTVLYTKRWDASIAKVASGVEEVCARLRARGLVAA